MRGGESWELLLKGPHKVRLEGLGLEASSVSFLDGEDGTVKLSFFLKETGRGERIFDWAVVEGFKILSMTQKRLSLEEIFVKLTNDDNGEGGPP
jgi:ABC-2 type transport system ATP-binding protein